MAAMSKYTYSKTCLEVPQMAYEDRRTPAEAPHSLVLEGRERLMVSGVTDVESFDEAQVVMGTCRGGLTIRGQGLHMERLSVDTGDVAVTGLIDSMEYDDAASDKGGFFSRLFR